MRRAARAAAQGAAQGAARAGSWRGAERGRTDAGADAGTFLYTSEEKLRRDRTPWTTVQAVLAPLQFAVFLAGLALAVRFLSDGEGFRLACLSMLLKVGLLYTIMVTGAFWEKAVFGRWLMAPAFFWEDVVGLGVVALHTACLLALLSGWLQPARLMALTLLAYASYLVNAGQFVRKLRLGRRPAGGMPALVAVAGS